MKLSKNERETIVNFNEAESTASVYTHNRPLRRKLESLAEDRSEDCKLLKITHDGQAAEYIVPKGWIKVRPPRKVSTAQIEALKRGRENSLKNAG